MKQVTFSTDLIYDTLREHDPDHIVLLKSDSTRCGERVTRFTTFDGLADSVCRQIDFIELPKVSPMAIPIVLNVRS